MPADLHPPSAVKGFIRFGLQWSQKELAARLGIAEADLSRKINGMQSLEDFEFGVRLGRIVEKGRA